MTYAEEEELFPTLPADDSSGNENKNMDNIEADKTARDSAETTAATENGKRKLPETDDSEKKVTHSVTFIFLQVKGYFWLFVSWLSGFRSHLLSSSFGIKRL